MIDEVLRRLEDKYLEPDEPKGVFICDCCGDEIYENEVCCVTDDGKTYCQRCIHVGPAEREDDELW